MNILERFIQYVQIDTKSDDKSGLTPSTPGQLVLAEKLKKELETMGLEVDLNEKSYLICRIKGNLPEAPSVGFISHLDTAPDARGDNVKPIVHENYDGGVLNVGNGVFINPNDTPDLQLYKGHTIITSDGTTLLGGDDKGGIAAIMTAVEEIINDREMARGDVVIGFTPDEEIGEGGDNFDVDAFGAEFAYTIDGETMGEFNYETFNAAEATIKIKGHNVHPGNAKGKMINASDIACKIATMMPAKARPEYTSGYEGFIHLCEMQGAVEEAQLIYIIRDFSRELLEEKKEIMKAIVSKINLEFGNDVAEISIRDEYNNMREVLEENKEVVEYAKRAYEKCGLPFNIKPIRGGTDGSKLSFKGLPCPNIFVGGNNLHSVGEFVSLDAMTKAKDIIVEIVRGIGESYSR